MMKENRLRKGIIRFLFWLAGACLFCLSIVFVIQKYTLWISQSTTFVVQKIEVEGNDLVPESEILHLGTIPKGKSIWRVNLRESEKRIETNPFIRKAVVARHFPDAICMKIEEKKPVALLNAGGTFFSIDQNGIVLPAKPGKLYDLPVVSIQISEPVGVGKQIRQESIRPCLGFLLIVLQKRSELYSEISELRFSKWDGLTVYTKKRGIPVRMGSDDFEYKIRYLEALLSEWDRGRNDSGIDYIDLRFQGQVVLGMGA